MWIISTTNQASAENSRGSFITTLKACKRCNFNNPYFHFRSSQAVFAYGAEKLGFDPEAALKISATFGGGMWNGDTCGCVTGGLMALGLKYGQCKAGDAQTKATMLARRRQGGLIR